MKANKLHGFSFTHYLLGILLAGCCGILGATAARSSAVIRFISLPEAQHAIASVDRTKLDSSLGQALEDQQAWNTYVHNKDRELRSRLQQGDLDTLANLLLFGTSYTQAPVITPELLRSMNEQVSTQASTQSSPGISALRVRAHDLTLGLQSPLENQRLNYMRGLLEQRGFAFHTPAELDKVQTFLVSNLLRMIQDDQKFAEALKRAGAADPESHFRMRSQVFEQRGISIDTSLFPNFAIDEALKQLKAQGRLHSHSVRKIAIVGPGLDVINKDVGFDYYPEQTIQPFAVIDSLLRLGLAAPGLSLTTLDISDNVNSHISAARRRALHGESYTIQLPLRSDVNWTREALDYWQSFGSAIGTATQPLAPLSATDLRRRAVRVPPAMVLKVRPVDLNVVLQSLELPENEKFDLIVGTNIFVYYGEVEQRWAEVNLGHMLKPGGILLTNDALPAAPELPLKEIGASTTVYSDRNSDGDRMVWMQRREDGNNE